MYHLALAEEFNYFVDVGVVAQPQNIVVCGAGFLLCRKIFDEVGDRVGFGLEIRRRERNSRGVCGVDRVAVVDIVSAGAVLVKALRALAVGKLTYYAADDLQMGKLVSSMMLSIDTPPEIPGGVFLMYGWNFGKQSNFKIIKRVCFFPSAFLFNINDLFKNIFKHFVFSFGVRECRVRL